MNTLKQAQQLLDQNNVRIPSERIELLIYKAFLDWKASGNIDEFSKKLISFDKKCSLKHVLVYLETFLSLEKACF